MVKKMEYQGTEDYLSEILFWGVATVWDPNPEKPQKLGKKTTKVVVCSKIQCRAVSKLLVCIR